MALYRSRNSLVELLPFHRVNRLEDRSWRSQSGPGKLACNSIPTFEHPRASFRKAGRPMNGNTKTSVHAQVTFLQNVSRKSCRRHVKDGHVACSYGLCRHMLKVVNAKQHVGGTDLSQTRLGNIQLLIGATASAALLSSPSSCSSAAPLIPLQLLGRPKFKERHVPKSSSRCTDDPILFLHHSTRLASNRPCSHPVHSIVSHRRRAS